MDDHERFFQQITSAVLNHKLARLDDYARWLMKDVQAMEHDRSAVSGTAVLLPPFDFYRRIKGRSVVFAEAYGIVGGKRLDQGAVERLSLSNAKKVLKPISITTPDTELGVNRDLTECSVYYNTVGCYRSSLLFEAKSCAYCFWPRKTVYSLGSHYLFDSQFCIKCYNSASLNRCFELSDCNGCSDSMFSYNCEGLSECMFCFNAKNLRYAIGNVPMPPSEYKAVKARMLAQVADELEKTKAFRFGIYDLGCRAPGISRRSSTTKDLQ